MTFTYDYYKKIADYIKARLNGFEPDTGIILGSGLAHFAEKLENPTEIMYRDIPGFLDATAPFQVGKLIFGTLSGKKLMCMAGRFHSYEGYEFAQLALPVRVMKLCGVKRLISTCAVGGINTSYRRGDIVIINDHIKLPQGSPMAGPNIDELGPRFFDMTNAYDRNLRAVAMGCADKTVLRVHEGVYFFFAGPQFETPAEIRAAKILGGDVAGMSLVTETITAAHCGMPLLAVALVTNMAAGVSEAPLSSEEVGATAESVAPEFEKYIAAVLDKI